MAETIVFKQDFQKFAALLKLRGRSLCLHQGFSNGALGPPLGATERFSGNHEQRPSLGSCAVILHNTSVTIY